MRLIAIFLSVATLIYLSYHFIVEQKASQTTEKALSSPILITPAYISDTPLAVEQVWQELKAERIKGKQSVEKKEDNSLKNKDVLTIGENKYALYGIFNANQHSNRPFILIKSFAKKGNSEKALMLKIFQGREISEGITLAVVTSNSISFKQNNELIEFKLFEAKK